MLRISSAATNDEPRQTTIAAKTEMHRDMASLSDSGKNSQRK
jgi:hypothetical protein